MDVSHNEFVAAIALQSSPPSPALGTINIIPLTVCDILQWCMPSSGFYRNSLVYAVRRLEPVIITKRILLEDQRDNGAAVFVAANECGHVDAVKQIIKCNRSIASAELTSAAGKRSALFVACIFGHADVVNALLSYDPYAIKQVDEHNRSPLYFAATYGHLSVIQLLLQHDATLVDVRDNKLYTALEVAACEGHVDVVRVLKPLMGTAATAALNAWNRTALHLAARGGHIDVMRVLLELDPSLWPLQDRWGTTALELASKDCCPSVLKELMEMGRKAAEMLKKIIR
eukprot:PhF_6_TR37539/c0_g1_i6/m.55589